MYRHGMWMDTSACIHVCKDGMRGLSALCVYVCTPSDTEVQMGIVCEYVCNSIYTCLYRDGAVLFMDACVFILVGTHDSGWDSSHSLADVYVYACGHMHTYRCRNGVGVDKYVFLLSVCFLASVFVSPCVECDVSSSLG